MIKIRRNINLLHSVWVVAISCSTYASEPDQDIKLGQQFAKCAADVSVFHNNLPNLTLSDSDPKREKAILWIASNYTLISNFLLGKEDSEQLIRNRMASADSEARAALNAGKQNEYISSFLENVKACSSLHDESQTALKAKIKAYAAEH